MGRQKAKIIVKIRGGRSVDRGVMLECAVGVYPVGINTTRTVHLFTRSGTDNRRVQRAKPADSHSEFSLLFSRNEACFVPYSACNNFNAAGFPLIVYHCLTPGGLIMYR